METIIKELSGQLNLKTNQIEAVLKMLEEGSTVPFIARYRKEVTGSLDEEQIRTIEKAFSYTSNLQKRKEEVIRLIDEKGLLTDQLRNDIINADKLQKVEDLYLPYKTKKRTKATDALDAGLEPLAKQILGRNFKNLNAVAKNYVNDKVESLEKAIEGAGFIISEWISENVNYREFIRKNMYNRGILETKVKRNVKSVEEAKKYEMYFEFSQQVGRMPGYRILAINRAEREKVINVKISIDEEYVQEWLAKRLIKTNDEVVITEIKKFIADSLKRLILPSIERETRKELTVRADEGAITLFADNLDKLIMQPPCKDAWILGVDPAFRTGCKLAVINPQGKLEKIDVIYPHLKGNKEKHWNSSIAVLNKIKSQFPIDQIVVGNGTASRETETFLKQNFAIAPINIISEAGASVYSASKLAQEEFPDLEVQERSAASIARRYQDPMAELVKIDPQSIGVGQYQHDVNQKQLAESLNFVMLKNINQVGVDLNTASEELLKFVSGLDRSVAKNIVSKRNEIGKFSTRKQLLDVKRLGKKAFEQSAGFLKIAEGDNLLDSTFIHPENYELANAIMKELNIDTSEIGEKCTDIVSKANASELATKFDSDLIIVSDILKALTEPMLDIRESVNNIEFDASIKSIEDLVVGMQIKGQVRNIVEFGAFIDIGIKNDGLAHISQLSNKFIKDVRDVVSIGDVVNCKVLEIDTKRNKVQLSLKDVN